MRNLLRALVLAACMLPGVAAAQCFSSTPLPANTVLGRLGIGPGPCQAIPFTVLLSNVGSVPLARNINTTSPLAGGGNLGSDLTLSITGAAGKVLAGSPAAFTNAPALGVAGSSVGSVAFANATSGSVTLQPATGALGSAVASLPAGTYNVVGDSLTQTLSSKTFVAPVLGAATATSINGNTFTAGTYTLTGAAAKTLTFNNSITLAGTDATTMTFPGTSATIARTDAGQTFTGANTFGGATTLNAALTYGGVTLANAVTGTGNMVLSSGPAFSAASFAGNVNFTSTFQIGGNTQTFPAAAATLTQTIASGTSTMGTSAIASGACATVVTTTATGVATTDSIITSFNANPTGTTGYTPGAMLSIIAVPTSGNVNFYACNNTGSTITPTAVTLNWRVLR